MLLSIALDDNKLKTSANVEEGREIGRGRSREADQGFSRL
jgi:hypothetical protein